MDGTNPVDVRLVQHYRLYTLCLLCPLRFGLDEVDGGQEIVRCQQLRHLWTYLVAEYRQYADNLTPFSSLQLAYLIISFHYLGWLNEHRLAGCRLIMNNSLDLALQRRSHGNHQTAVAQSGTGVLVNKTVTLCGM